MKANSKSWKDDTVILCKPILLLAYYILETANSVVAEIYKQFSLTILLKKYGYACFLMQSFDNLILRWVSKKQL